jgi:hypothetical protein
MGFGAGGLHAVSDHLRWTQYAALPNRDEFVLSPEPRVDCFYRSCAAQRTPSTHGQTRLGRRP